MPLEKKTKIFCTMGPACWDVPTLLDLDEARTLQAAGVHSGTRIVLRQAHPLRGGTGVQLRTPSYG